MEKQIEQDELNKLKQQMQNLVNRFESAIKKLQRRSEENEVREKEGQE